ncbi:MAG: preprotein translocase subunit SecE [SAR86 cluster bacterium]|uniref:Protein translocase subunit SecE n=1 Tax=SAR86 cluster bacterium TaxID=2030880 RepID=A0A2A5AE93_9GAMM|nr:MAG: preprotein translocase subunit SecE [SAR86 cluster bacterium]
MSDKTSSENSSLDWVKWIAVAAIAAGAIYTNSYFSTESLLFRTIGILLATGAAGWIAAQTVKGRSFVNLCLEARIEIRKVVWPTRQETTQTTIVVLIVIFIVATILWLLDWGLNSAISSLIG